MRDHHEGGPRLLGVVEQERGHPITRCAVEVARGLVGEDERRSRGQRAREGDTLSFPPRQPPRAVVEARAETDRFEQVGGSRLRLPIEVQEGGHAVGKQNVVEQVEVFEEFEVLEDQPELQQSEIATIIGPQLRELHAVDADSTSIGREDSGDEMEQRGLASPTGSHDRDPFPLGDAERGEPEGEGPGRIVELDALCFDHDACVPCTLDEQSAARPPVDQGTPYPMSRSLGTRLVGAVASGIVVGLVAVVGIGPVEPPDREGRLVVDASYLQSVGASETARLGRPPRPSELARALESRIDADVLAREAAVRGLVSDPAGTEASVGHLQRVASARWLAAPLSDAEVIAFAEFRRDRYGELIPAERALPPAGDPQWTTDPALQRLLVVARADVRASERLASRNQFLAEIASRHPVTLSRAARALLAGGSGAGEGPDAVSPAGAPGGEPQGWSVRPEDPWSGSASVFVEETETGSYALTLLVPPGTGDDGVRLNSACGAGDAEAVVPVFSGDGGDANRSWRVVRGTLQCATGVALLDDVLEVSAPAGVAGDLELRRLDGSAFVSMFDGGELAIDLAGAQGGGSASAGFLSGLTDVLRLPALWLLGVVAGWLGPGAMALTWGVVGMGGGYGLGRWTAGTGGPTTAFGVAEILALLAVVTLAFAWALSGRRTVAARVTGSPLVLFGLLGLLFGGTFAPVVAQAGGWIDGGSGVAGSFAGGVGAGLALAPMIAVGWGLAAVASRHAFGWGVAVAGVACIAALAYSALVAFPMQVSGVRLDVGVLALALGLLLALTRLRLDTARLATAGLLLVIGLVVPLTNGWAGYPSTFASGTVVAACLFAAGLLGLGATGGGRARGRGRALLGVAALGSVAVGLHLSAQGLPSGAAASSSALGSGAAALLLGWLAAHAVGATPEATRPTALRFVSLAALALAVAIRLPDYLGPLTESVRADLAFGRLPIPVVAVVLGIVALLIRPRRRRVVQELGIQGRTRGLHRWYAVGAFLLLPFGVFHVALPLQAGSVPSDSDAYRIVDQLLTDTYEAFDLTEEEALYDRLAETVTGDLLPTLFLENRRGLVSGAGDVDEVSVLDVVVAPGGVVGEAPGPGAAFAWTGEWAVSARVAHLVHVHLRENLYTGRVTVRADAEGWKLDAVELTAEERVARPWGGA